MMKTWKNIDDIPDKELWEVHKKEKKIIRISKRKCNKRLRRSGYSYDEINEIVIKIKSKCFNNWICKKICNI